MGKNHATENTHLGMVETNHNMILERSQLPDGCIENHIVKVVHVPKYCLWDVHTSHKFSDILDNKTISVNFLLVFQTLNNGCSANIFPTCNLLNRSFLIYFLFYSLLLLSFWGGCNVELNTPLFSDLLMLTVSSKRYVSFTINKFHLHFP